MTFPAIATPHADPLSVELDGVGLVYDRRTVALDDLTLRMEGGKIYGLLGRNGSGKTSLLSVLAAFLAPSSGRVRIGGRPVWERRDITREICLIRAKCDTVGTASRITEALVFAADTRPYWDPVYASDLLDRFELSERKKIGGLSTGERSELGIVLGLASRAPLTMLDESYLGLDAPSRQIFYDALLEDFIAHPRTIVISTHLIEEVGRLFEEVVMLDHGRLLLHEQTEAVRARGATVTGHAAAIDRFVDQLDGLSVLGSRQLGPTKSIVVYGELDSVQRESAETAGLELGPIGLQELFVHLTRGEPA